MKKTIIFLLLTGLLGFFTSCEKDEDKVIMLSEPVAPVLTTLPNLTLERSNATQTITFKGTAVDPGFVASATYRLEACPSGDNFVNKVTVFSGTQDSVMSIKVSALNGMFLDILPADQVSSVDFRITSTLVVDAGTGAPGTSADPFEYISDIVTQSVTVFGLPRLDLLNSGMDQIIQSANGDGVYTGIVKLDAAQAFTLYDPDGDVSYGGSSGALTANGAAITADPEGWVMLTVDLNNLTYEIAEHSMGIIGTAVPPYDWSEDINMDYDQENKYWYITLELKAGVLKFRLNNGWGWNMGFVEGTTDPGLTGPTQQGGVGNDIPVPSDGTYTVRLTVYSDSEGFYEFIPNN
ncbi:SusE domain-containing protein [Saccharicrinis sp. FJH54]|uniref:SusE domain-containing protein n=1 Tax=Saccharicrinis sp. FJH54 TaxID=3344665 RepID=UPI0035D434B5